jgi:DNA polymerase (family X)
MSVNAAVAERFGQIAEMLELLGMDKFRILAHQKAARVIEALSVDLKSLCDDRKALMEIEGIGPKIADKIIEYCKTGKITEHEELCTQVPAGLAQIMKIPGLGPKTARLLWQERGVTDIASLKKIIDDGSILTVPRMGAKTVENIKASLTFVETVQQRLPLGLALPAAELFVARMLKVKGVTGAAFAGSLRRGRDTIGDLDLVVCSDDPAAAGEAFRAMPEVEKVLAAGDTKSSIRARIVTSPSRNVEAKGDDEHTMIGGRILVQVDMRVVPEASWGAALLYFTGSKDHNVKLRERALKKKLTLNEWGLFPNDKEPTPPQARGVKPVAGATEDEVYAKLGLPYIPPEIREDRGELELKETPRLIEVADIKAELHAHTTASDGAMSILDLAQAAKKRGFHTIAITDHSKSQVQANGLKADRLAEHCQAVREAQKKVKGITLLTGSEVDILTDGSLDYPDDVLAELDIVVASPHAALFQKPEVATARLVKAIESGRVHILGHPTGRLVNRRAGLSPDMDKVIAAAKAHNVALEINAHWHRLDLRDTHVYAAVKAGCLIAINCDTHTLGDMDNLRYGVLTGRRGWLTAEQCINCWEANHLHKWLKRGKA